MEILENALKRADGFIIDGRKPAALQHLHDLITSNKRLIWDNTLERIMLKYVELCVDLHRGRFAKDGLIQYKNICQHANVCSLQLVIEQFLQLSIQKAEEAQKQAHNLDTALKIDDLESDSSPEDLRRSFVREEEWEDEFDINSVRPWFRFLWETYTVVLQILRNNSKLQMLYFSTACRALQFCKKYKRTTEFCRLGERIRNHLAHPKAPTMYVLAPENLQQYLNIKMLQLKVATGLGLWQEAFRCIEDIHSLMCMVKIRPNVSSMVLYYTALIQIFWASKSHLYHAYAWSEMFSLQKCYNKNLTRKDIGLIASSAVLAALSVVPYDHMCGTYGTAFESEKQCNSKMAKLIRFDLDSKSVLGEELSRATLLSELVYKGVMSWASREVNVLYNLLEHEVIPLDLPIKVQLLLAKISEVEGKLFSATSVLELQLAQYVPALENLSILRLLQQASQVHQTFTFDSLFKSLPFGCFKMVEKAIEDAVEYKFIPMTLNLSKGAIIFENLQFESDGWQDHATAVAEPLIKARSSKLGIILPEVAQTVDKEGLEHIITSKQNILEKQLRKQEASERKLANADVRVNFRETSRRTQQAPLTRISWAEQYEQREKIEVSHAGDLRKNTKFARKLDMKQEIELIMSRGGRARDLVKLKRLVRKFDKKKKHRQVRKGKEVKIQKHQLENERRSLLCRKLDADAEEESSSKLMGEKQVGIRKKEPYFIYQTPTRVPLAVV